ncbi:MAG: methionine adenosyltransferase [Alphaproteobacteria bacterium]|nr:methionine adenosyltransferase [Alphaproteobacteria bacterium]
MNAHYPIRDSYIFTSESVSEGHPDKICDQISDAIVDACLAENPEARCAIETLACTNQVVVAGEYRGADAVTPARMEEIARAVVKDIGYTQAGFGWNTFKMANYVHQQSADIARGVDSAASKDEGAGDQGIMFGFACTETPDLMPATLYYSHRILQALSQGRRSGKFAGLQPDAKSQVSLEYRDGAPVRATSVVVSTQHDADFAQKDIRELVRGVVTDILPAGWMPEEGQFFVNPTGQFIIGGPDGDSGLTGRKIIVDTYGGASPHGGGAFSGKDPTKVDRSAAYAARYLAKNVVAAGIAERCTIQLSYAIGVSRPTSFYVNTHAAAKVDPVRLEKLLQELVNLSPRGIRTHLNLNRPIYLPTASYGHFGRTPTKDGHFSWEKTDLVEALRREFGISAAA